MDFQSNGSNGSDETNGLAETNPVFNGSSAVKRVIADPARENVLVLPAGVSLDDIKVDGSNLVIALPDGSEMVVINGAIYVPEIVIDGVTVPPMNLAALLISDEPQPAAGQSQSSGGDFADPVNPIDPAYALGDLLPYTELFFPEPQDEEIIPGLVNEIPEITFIPETGDGTIVDEDGLEGNTEDRPESPGTMDQTDDEATTGTILYVSPDGTDRLLIDGMDVFQIVDGELVIQEPFVSGYTIGNGTLVINAVDIVNGSITYTYTLNDNTSGDDTFVEFDITVIDPDGDSDTGTARIDIIDDNPFTNDDGNLATLDDNAAGVVVGSVAGLLTNDEYGADGAGSPAITIGTGDLGGTIQIVDGNLVYTSGANVAPGDTAVETFTYTILDGDGDVSNSSTFTVTLTDEGPSIADLAASVAVDEEGLGGIAGGTGDLAGEATVQSGTLAGLAFGIDGMGDIALAPSADTGLVSAAGNAISTSWDAVTHTLTGQDSVTGETVFTLEITDVATGAYTFTLLQPVTHPDASTEDDATFQVTVTVTDAEGDAATGAIAILIDDDSPVITTVDAAIATAVLDESAAGTDEGGDFDPAGLASVTVDYSGNFSLSNDDTSADGFGADVAGSVSYALNLSGSDVASGLFALDGTSIVLNLVDGDIVGTANGDEYVRISVDADTGVVTFTQSANVMHGDTTSDDDTAALLVTEGGLTLTATATDSDGDTSSASIDLGNGTFQIEDDGPKVGAQAIGEGEYIATTDDDGSPNTDSFELSAIFSTTAATSYGTDGAGSLTEAFGLSLLVEGDAASGLFSGGETITLSLSETATTATVTGATVEGTVFTISVDKATGTLTLTQSAPIDHGEDSDLAVLANGLVEATYDVTIVDADGDSESASSSFDLGGNVQFNDDTPGIVATGIVPVAVLDESPAGEDEGGDFDPAGLATVNVDFSVAFEPSDSTPNATAFGADVPGDVSYALGLDGTDVASGLFTLDGDAIVLNLVGGEIVGTAGGSEYVRISVDGDTGVVTFTQSGNVMHGDTTSDDDTASLVVANGALTLTATATDFDGDSASASIDLGNGTFQIEDDGPYATDDGVFMVMEDLPLLNIDVFANDDAGTDGIDLATGIEVVTGPTKGTVTYNGDGTFNYTPTAGQVGTDTFTYQITDGDGDTATAVVTLNLAPDSEPTIVSNDVTVDEDGLDGANPDSGQTDPLEVTSTGSASATGSIVVSYYADVPADPAAAFQFINVDALDGSISSDGQAVDFSLVGGEIVGTVDGGATTVITIALDGYVAGPNAGDITYTYSAVLSQAIDHADTGNSENTAVISGVSFQVTDSDGDPETGSVDVTIVDDVPAVTNVALGSSVSVDETDAGEAFVSGPISATSAASIISASLAFGADDAAGDPVYTIDIVG
ncbi:DUF5801 repeats-in-toxin domain-containing protein, partial [Croceicoccus gelatinilyticus]|uniref:DUF5801 repeats-in-toxin domain-containing protein n=1 Tax=Croceicoccus gelatinilyticus TaxID=2835536 RepID=UPI001BCC81BE